MPTFGTPVSVRQVQRQFQQVVTKVNQSKHHVIVMNRSQPQVAILSLAQLKEFERLQFLEKVRAEVRKLKIETIDDLV
jgi:prevent-host-death family protein